MWLVDELADPAAATLPAGTAAAGFEWVGIGVVLLGVQVMMVMGVVGVIASTTEAAIFRARFAVVVRCRPREHHHAWRTSCRGRWTSDLER